MKFLNTFVAMSMISLFAPPVFAESENGSTGTHGGGNNQVSFEASLPSQFSIEWDVPLAIYDWAKPIQIGTKRGWGVVPMNDYAQKLVGRVSFKKTELRNGRSGLEISSKAISSRNNVEMSFDELLKADSCYNLNAWLMDAKAEYLSVSVTWDGEKITPAAAQQALTAAWDNALLEVDFESPETLRNIPLAEQYFKQLLHRDLRVPFEKAFETFLNNKLEEVRSLALSAVGENDQCNQAQYELFLHRWANFKIGTKAYFNEVRLVSGYRFSDETVAAIQKARSTVRGDIAEAVDQYCRSTARQFTVGAE